MNTTEFVKQNKISLEWRETFENPNWEGDDSAHHYSVLLMRGKNKLSAFFSMGSGLVVKRGALVTPQRPTAVDVLDCLASDAAGVENARDFDDWASEYGYDTDSPRAEKTYRICQQQAEDLKKFLGEEAYKTLLWETERL